MTAFRFMLPAACALLASALGASTPVAAADVFRYDQQGAAAICQPSLPAQAGNLRARPLGLTNEGMDITFVTCTFQGDATPNGRGATQVEANVSLAGAVAAVISCTLVDGVASSNGAAATYTTRSAAAFPNAFGNSIAWVPGDLAGAPPRITQPAIQCALPPAATLHYLGRYYEENIGS